MRNIVLLIVLAVVCCSPMALRAEHNPHLVLPPPINMGFCPRGTEKDAIDRSATATLYNSSDQDLYLVNGTWITPNYSPEKYSKFGFIFYPYGFPSSGNPPIVIEAKKSIQVSIWFFSFDTGDTGAVEFKSGIVLRSRTSPIFPFLYGELFSDTLFFSATAVDSQTIVGSHLYYNESKSCPNTPDYFVNRGGAYFNNLKESVRLDSIQSTTYGQSQPKRVLPITNQWQEITLPFDISPKSGVSVGVEFFPRPLGESRTVVTGYFTGKDTKQHYTADVVLTSKDTALPEARFGLWSSYFESKKGEQVTEKRILYLNACSKVPLWADSVIFTGNWREDELHINLGVITFPLLMEPSEEYWLDLTYNPQTHGRTFGFAQAYFHTTDGRQIVRTLDFQTYYPDASSVSETPEETTAKPSLLLTTPLLSMKLLGEYAETPQVYDSFGSSIDVSARLTQGVLSFEGLSSGVYCLIFKTDAGMVSRKVLYVR